MRLAKAGYYSGDIGAVLNAPVDEIVSALEYELFLNQYETTYHELNKQGGKK